MPTITPSISKNNPFTCLLLLFRKATLKPQCVSKPLSAVLQTAPLSSCGCPATGLESLNSAFGINFGCPWGKSIFPCFKFYWGQLCHEELASRFGNGNKDGVVTGTGLRVSVCIMFQAAFLISHISVHLPHIRCPWHMNFPSALSN